MRDGSPERACRNPSRRVDHSRRLTGPWKRRYKSLVGTVRESHFEVIAGLCLACGLGSLGCRSWTGALWGSPASQESADPAVTAGAAATLFPGDSRRDPARVVDLAFDVTQIDLPLDGVQESRKIWNHVDETRVEARLAAHLARNGLRVGAAGPSTWEPIRAILDAVGAQARRDQLVPSRGLPLAIQLGSLEEGASLFAYAKDGRLVGKTFPGGDEILDVEYAYHPEFGGTVDLGLSWEIRRDQGELAWETRDGVVRQAPAFDRHVFTDLHALVTLHPSEFLVIGLSAEARNKYLIGRRFLSSERAGKNFETMLMITPKAVEAAAPRRGS